MRARKASHSSNSSWRLQFSRWLQFCHGAGWIKFCARETVAAAMEKERALVQFFDQFGLDARAAAADDVIGAPAVRVHQNQLQIARHFDVSGQAPRVQLIRYYRQ